MRLVALPVLALTLLVAPSLGAQGGGATGSTGATTSGASAAAARCSSPAQETAAHELVAMSGAEAQVKQSADAIIEAQLRAAPQMAEYFGDLIRTYVGEQMQWSMLEPEFARLYCELFEERELRDMIAFNRTPLGQKILRQMPELMRRAAAMGEARMQANMPEFQRRIEERMTKLRADGKIPD